jgi:prepilin-type N-terminal cleavage/methylation domain-containing protein
VHAESVSPPPRSTGGFTLIEVMIAMVILAVGLLSLEALGIGAARLNTLAQKQSRYTAVAVSGMEELRNAVHAAPATLPITRVAKVPVSGSDTVLVARSATRAAARQARLTVTVTPTTTGSKLVRAAPVTLDSHLFNPNIP